MLRQVIRRDHQWSFHGKTARLIRSENETTSTVVNDEPVRTARVRKAALESLKGNTEQSKEFDEFNEFFHDEVTRAL